MSDKLITLITGTRKGIGKFLAEYYVNKGHTVIGCSRSVIDWSLGGYTHFVTDVSEEKDVVQLFSEIRKNCGKLDHLLNNAGIASLNHSLLTPTSTATKVLNTNFIGSFIMSREAAKLMSKNRFGRIINFSTVAVPLRLEGEAVYASSKAAIINLTQILAKELGSYGITVNCIGPTPIKTDLIRAVPQEKIGELIKNQAIKRFGNFEDIANVIDFYMDKKSDFITGQNIYLGGIS